MPRLLHTFRSHHRRRGVRRSWFVDLSCYLCLQQRRSYTVLAQSPNKQKMATKTPILSLAVFRQSYRMELYHGYLVYIVAMTTLPATIVSLSIACAERATQYVSK